MKNIFIAVVALSISISGLRALDLFESADGLIVDLRSSEGGDYTYALTEFGRLTEEEIWNGQDRVLEEALRYFN